VVVEWCSVFCCGCLLAFDVGAPFNGVFFCDSTRCQSQDLDLMALFTTNGYSAGLCDCWCPLGCDNHLTFRLYLNMTTALGTSSLTQPAVMMMINGTQIYESSRRRNGGDMQQVPHCGPTTVRRHRTVFSCSGAGRPEFVRHQIISFHTESSDTWYMPCSWKACSRIMNKKRLVSGTYSVKTS
jgi:hypothetical protein